MATKETEEILDRLRDLTVTTARLTDLSVDSRDELRRLAEKIAALEGPVARLVAILEAKDKAMAEAEAVKVAGKSAFWTMMNNPAITAAIAAIIAALLSRYGLPPVGGANASP